MALISQLPPLMEMRSITISWIMALASSPKELYVHITIQYGFLNDSFENIQPQLSCHTCSSVMPVPPDSDTFLSSGWSSFHMAFRLIYVRALSSPLST